MTKAIKFFGLLFILNIIVRLVVNFFQADNPIITLEEIAELAGLSAVVSIIVPLCLKYDRQ